MKAGRRFSPETLEQIKQRISLKDVISKHATGMVKKGRDWWACCPFHHENTPSFHIHESRGYYHCFGCGAHGNVFDFVSEMRGGNFGETVVYLAEMCGVQLEEERVDPKVEQFKANGYSALAAAKSFFKSELKGAPRDYFYARGLTDALIEEFGLGYAPDEWASLGNHLTQKGVSAKMLLEAGLSVEGKKGNYDRFRNRVMFPIENLQDKVVGFGGRVLGEGEPKYLNSAETKFFNKRFTLYNLNRAREAIRRQEKAVIVEGYMDVIGLWRQGVEYAVAPLGTAITEDQIKLLWRFHSAPIVCLDGDTAGRGAAVRVAKRVLSIIEPGKTLTFAWMPEGEDPDSFVKTHGKQAFEHQISQTASLEDVLWMDITEGLSLKNGEDRAAIEKAVTDLGEQIADATVKRHMLQALKNRLWQKNEKKMEQKEHVNLKRRGQDEEQARILLSILFRKPQLLERFSEKLSDVRIENQQLNGFRKTLFQLFAEGGVETNKLRTHLGNTGLLEETQKGLNSALVERTPEEDLSSLWLEVYDRLEADDLKSTRKARQQATKDLFSADADDAWQKLKNLHAERGR